MQPTLEGARLIQRTLQGGRVLSRLRGSKRIAGAAGLVMGLAATTVSAEIQINREGWKFPNIVSSAKEIIRISDRTPLIAGKETILKGYRKMDGTHFMTFEIEGRVFGVQIDTDGKPPFEYGIMDADGDGVFETKILPGKDQAYVPQWVIDLYYSKHPEQKDPSGAVRPLAPTLIDAPKPEATPTPPPRAVRPPPEILSQPTP